MTNPKEYKISTIKDIFDKVPSDRIPMFLDELKIMLANSAFVLDSFELIAGNARHSIEFPEFITWIDDGKGEVTVKVGVDGSDDEYVQIKTTLGATYE